MSRAFASGVRLAAAGAVRPGASLLVVLALVFAALLYLAILLLWSLRPGSGKSDPVRAIEQYGPQGVRGGRGQVLQRQESPVARRAVGLMSHGLIDEFRFMVSPIALGSGTPVFAGLEQSVKLRLIEWSAFKSGNVLLRYAL